MDVSRPTSAEARLLSARQTQAAELLRRDGNARGDSPPRADAISPSTVVSLSALGQLKNALGELAAAGMFVADALNARSAEDAGNAAKRLVSTYNVATRTLVETYSAKHTEAQSEAGRIAAASLVLRQAVATAAPPNELNRIGIVGNADGTLALDTKAFERALQSNRDATRTTLARLGNQLEQAANRQPATPPKPGPAIDRPSPQTTAVETRRQTERPDDTQRVVEQQARQVEHVVAGGLATYQKMFSR